MAQLGSGWHFFTNTSRPAKCCVKEESNHPFKLKFKLLSMKQEHTGTLASVAI